MIARGFKPVAWVAAIGTAALGCYMLSLRVASERAELAGLERKIVTTQKAIRSLETELDTRGRVTQLQQWNDDILALVPPSAGQFLESQMMLAQFQVQPTPAIQNPAEVRMAAAEMPASAPSPSVTPSAQRAVAAPRPAQQATVQRASLNVPPQAATEPPVRIRTVSTETPPRPRALPPRRTETRTTPPQIRAQTAPQRQRTAANTASQRAQPASSTPQRARPAAVTTQPPRTRVAAVTPAQRSRTTPTQTPRRAAADDRSVRDTAATSRTERRGGTRN